MNMIVMHYTPKRRAFHSLYHSEGPTHEKGKNKIYVYLISHQKQVLLMCKLDHSLDVLSRQNLACNEHANRVTPYNYSK